MTDHPHIDYVASARRYPVFLFFLKASYWAPVFFLYFNSLLSLAEVLLLEAIYYIGVVILEVPTGYLADRVGARRVLIGSSVAQMAACTTFVSSGHFAVLAAGQILLALGMSLSSGSDTAYHYSVVQAAGKGSEYGQRESRAARTLLMSQATSALIGGFAAVYDLRIAYGLTIVSSLVAATIASRFSDVLQDQTLHLPIGQQLIGCLRDAKHPHLAWLLAFYIYMTVVNHIPYEFYQPLIRDLIGSYGTEAAPAATGLHNSLSLGLAGIAAAYSIRLLGRLGASPTLLLAGLFQTAIISSMSFAHSPAIALVLALRSVPRGLTQAPLNAEVVPLIGPERRATYLSIQSLLGRLAFGSVLFTFSLIFEGNEIAGPIYISAIGAAVGLALLALFAPLSRRFTAPAESSRSTT